MVSADAMLTLALSSKLSTGMARVKWVECHTVLYPVSLAAIAGKASDDRHLTILLSASFVTSWGMNY